MFQHVKLQAAFGGISVAALLTLIRFLTRVGALMSNHISSMSKDPITLLAFKRFFTRVNALMYCQIGSSRKAFTTVRALIGLHTRVYELVL